MAKKLRSVGLRLKDKALDRNFVRKMKNVVVVVAYALFIVALMNEVVFAAQGDNIFDGFQQMLDAVKGKILGFSTAAVVIGVGVGAMMKKFSMGKQDKIEMGNKLMKDSIIAFVILNATPRILNFVTSYLGSGTNSINT
ncbi:MAG: hypothetical protein J6Y29_05160 [Clostridiales bacterium]|nr:hypothetical protein [Clostridiales bacterium]